MEPITISHGLLKHSVRCMPIAMRILGNINHSTPAHLPSLADLDTALTHPQAYLRDNLVWLTYLLNETHMQIQFVPGVRTPVGVPQ
jgi:hypothetical protein